MTNSRYKILIISVLLLLILNLVTIAVFWFGLKRNPLPPSEMEPKPPMTYLEKELNFTEVQKEQFRKLREEHFAKNRQYLDSLKSAKDAYFDLLKQKNVTDSIILYTHQKIEHWQREIDISVLKHFQLVRNLCDENQKQKFDEIIEDIILQASKPIAPRPGAERPMEELNDDSSRATPLKLHHPDDKVPD